MADFFGSNYANAMASITGVADSLARRRAGAALSSGDYAGATGALFQGGDIEGGFRLQDRQADLAAERAKQADLAKAQQLDFTLKAVRALKEVRATNGNVVEAYQSLAPAFQQMGVDPQQIQQIGGLLQQDPGFLDKVEQIVGEQQRELSFQKAGDNLLVFEGGNPDPVRTFEPDPKPIVVNGVVLDPETYEPIVDAREPKIQTVQNSDGSSSVVAIDQPPPRVASGDIAAMESAVLGIPGTAVTSGRRSAAENAAIPGAAPNSYHLTGQARDFRIPQGMTSAQFAQEVRQRLGAGWEVIDEGNAPGGPHIHVEPAGKPAAAPGVRVVASGANNGPSPAQARADARLTETERRNQIKDTATLRREFNARQEVKDFNTVSAAYDSVQSAARAPSAAGDLSLIFAYMKILDPSSVVREQEFANAQNAAGVPDRVRNAYNKVLNGQRLNPNQRNDFLRQAQGLYQTRLATYNRVAEEYRREAELSELEPDRVAATRAAPPTASRPAPPPPNVPTALWRTSSPQQQQYWTANPPRGRRGSQTNPLRLNPADPNGSAARVRPGSYVLTPDGKVRRKPG